MLSMDIIVMVMYENLRGQENVELGTYYFELTLFFRISTHQRLYYKIILSQNQKKIKDTKQTTEYYLTQTNHLLSKNLNTLLSISGNDINNVVLALK